MVENPATRALREGVIVGLANHTILIGRDGTERPIDDSAAPIRCKEGKIVGCVLVFRDITERHRQQAELRERTAQLDFALASTGVGLWLNPLPFGELHWDARTSELFCVRPGERPTIELFWSRLHPDDREPTRLAVEVALRDRTPYDIDHRIVNPDTGEVRWVRSAGQATYNEDGVATRFDGVSQDITDRKRAEGDLREREAFIGGVFGSITDGFFAVCKDWRFTFANDEIVRRFGRRREGIVGGHIWELFPDAVGNEAYINLHRAMADRVAVEYEIFYPPLQRWFLDKAFPTSDGGLAVFTRDITERKGADDRLRQSEARLRRVFESNVVGMIRWDLDRSLILDANAEFLRMTGYTRDDVTGGRLNFRDLTPPEWTARNEEGISTIRADGHAAPYEKEYFRKDGSRLPLIIAGMRFEDSPTEGMSFLIDISEAKRAEAQLRASELRLRLVVESATGYAIFTMNPEGIIDGWNAGAERLFGYTEAEVVGQHDRFLYTPDDAAQKIPEREMKKAAAEGRAVNERWHVRKGGDRFWGSGLVQPLRDGVKVIGFLKIMRDMTEQQVLQQALVDADRRKDEFLATLAHELRNPLAPIRNGLQLMGLAGGNGEAVEQARIMMDRQLGQMVRLVDDLMDVSRITRGKLELKKERLQLAEVINSAVETSRPLIEQMGHELTVILPKHSVVVEADLTRLAQVFVNLLNNAAKYSDSGGHIRLTAERQGSDVVITVKDNGIGIAADQLPHIFEMFIQVDRSLEKAQGGLGIGLTLVQRLVEMHDGRIEARSDGPGKGSEFVVRLPVVVEASVPPKSHDRHEGHMKSSLRILIVDDNRDSADSLAMMLKIMGNDTHTAYDGEEAVTSSEKFRPDVILLDIGLPKLNGYEACRRIRALTGGEKLVIIAQTGWGQDEDRQRTHDAGFDHHLVKPVEPFALMKLLAGLSDVRGNDK